VSMPADSSRTDATPIGVVVFYNLPGVASALLPATPG
jgi:hypothetical protein